MVKATLATGEVITLITGWRAWLILAMFTSVIGLFSIVVWEAIKRRS